MKLRALMPSLLCLPLLAACAVGPDYVRPDMPLPAHYKEAAPGWKIAAPADHAPRGAWWTVYADPELDRLVAALNANNQTLQVALANYRQARAAAQEARAGFFPTVGATASTSRKQTGGNQAVTNGHVFSLDASWEPDLWGQVRRTVEASDASTQASAASLAAAQLSAQAELVQDYLQLRVTERQRQLSADTTAA